MRKLVVLAAALSLAVAASLLPAPAMAWEPCSCSFCWWNSGQALCSWNGTTVQCSTYLRNACPL